MGRYILYNTDTGVLTHYGFIGNIADFTTLPANTAILDAPDVSVIGSTYYVALGNAAILSRPLLTNICSWDTQTISATGSNSATFGSALPANTSVFVQPPSDSGIGSNTYVTSTGSITFVVNKAGAYTVTFDVFPYQQYVATLTAV